MKFIITLFFGFTLCIANAQFPATYANTDPKINTDFPYNKARIEGNTNKSKKSGEYKYYNELNELIRTENYKKGKLVTYDIIKPQAYYYDQDSNLIEFHRYDVFGFCASSSMGMMGDFGPKDCIDKYVYDSNGNLLEEQYYSKKNELIEDSYSPSIILYEYNLENKLVKKTKLDHNRKPKGGVFGLCYSVYTYDKNGNRISIQHYSSNGEKSDGDYGTSTYQMKYDNRNNLIERRLLKPDGNLAGLDMNGAPKETFRYNENNLKIYSSGWTSETEMIGCYKMEYNSDGLLKTKMYYSSEDTINFASKTEYIYENGIKIGEVKKDSSDNIVSEYYSKIELKIDGWKLKSELPNINLIEGYGTIGFVFQLDNNGNVIGYTVTNRAGYKEYKDFCQDVINRLKFLPSGNSDNRKGNITFRKI